MLPSVAVADQGAGLELSERRVRAMYRVGDQCDVLARGGVAFLRINAMVKCRNQIELIDK